ncbi:hypothetical protein AB0B66_18880 [Catellatospora sp. NPDC049111]|uniref:hypothetical protein n=1 Tax=Catellatospora sp. NPDC049111 TaxID=3155271 RepID=UPI0033FCBE7B
MKDPWSVVLGAALALIGTALVQAWLVPKTQVKIRERDRWEKDLRELADLLAKKVVPSVTEYHLAARIVAVVEHSARTGKSDFQRKDEEWFKQTVETRNRLATEFDDHMDLVRILVGRLQHLNEHADTWIELRNSHCALQEAWRRYYLHDTRGTGWPSPDEFDAAYNELRSRALRLSQWIESLARENRPPKQRTVRRMWRQVRGLRLQEKAMSHVVGKMFV